MKNIGKQPLGLAKWLPVSGVAEWAISTIYVLFQNNSIAK
ncbi:hypothetical protein ANACOL_04259 [Anaerotruncus colihominis DSM 17241]|uniref:Uncharacterized protein n=1 Tax=Anaerotruncus colihominis DSM 17241 TaxID=445972 RepID=B0PHG6_9FIRM|nr:hypothetical protein ANACOL_04259 [Anaerotruncus colihominis DSM 17241]